ACGRVGCGRSMRGYCLTGVAGGEGPFASLPLQLDDEQTVLVGLRRRGCEVSRFCFQCEPTQRNCRVRAVHPHLRVRTVQADAQCAEVEQFGSVERKMVVAVVEGQGIFRDPTYMVPACAELRATGKIWRLLLDLNAGRHD